MAHARSQHPNAVLTPKGRRRMVAVCSSAAGRSRRPRSGSRSTPRRCASGGTGSSPRATPGLLDRSSRARIAHRIGRRSACGDGCCSCVARIGGAPTTSPTRSAWRPRRCSRSCDAAGCGRLDRGDRATARPPVAPLSARPAWRARPRRRQEARGDPDRRRLAACTAAATRRITAATAAPATATSTPPSMTAPGSSTPRSSTTNKPPPPPRSGTAPPPGSPPRHHRRTGPHRQRRLLPLAAWQPRLRRDRHDRQEDPALPAPDQRQGRALPPDPARGMGLHPRPGPQKPNAPPATTGSCTSTIATVPTARSAGQHPRHPHRPPGDNVPAGHT